MAEFRQTEFKHTWLTIEIQDAMNKRTSERLVSFLRRKYRSGATYENIAAEISYTYTINISPSTIGKYINQLGFSTRQMAARAWENDLAPVEVFEVVSA